VFREGKIPGKTVREKAKARLAAKNEGLENFANEINDFFRSL
jgi:hypothetical protein